MKYLLFLLVLSHSALATESNELVLGSLTYHVISFDNVAEEYANKLSNDGRLIGNFIIGYQKVNEDDSGYEAIAFFTGSNSIGKPLLGIKYSEGLKSGNLYYGAVVGGYLQNERDFERLNIQDISIAPSNDVGLVPIIGAEVNYRINFSHDRYIKINNIITPVLTNTTLSIGKSF